MNTFQRIITAGLFGGAVLTSPLQAQSTWTGSIDNNYNTAGNWSPSGVPALTTAVTISTGTPTFTGNDTQFQRRALTTINGGTLTLNDARFINGSGGPATVNLSSGGITQNNSTYFIVGQSGAGTFNQSGGLVDVTVGRGFFTSDGNVNGVGSYNLTGGTLDIKMNQYGSDPLTNELYNFWIGRTGNSTASVADSFVVNGGTLTLDVTGPSGATRNMLIARDSTFQVDTGSVTMSNLRSVVVGMTRNVAVFGGRNPSFVVNGGSTSIEVANGMVIGSATNGSLSVTGGSLTINGTSGDLRLGEASATTSILSSTVLDSATTSTITLSGGTLNVGGNIVLAVDSINTTSFSMTGGNLFATDIFKGAGTATFSFSGGQIQLAGDRTDILTETWFVGVPGTFANYDSVNDWTIVAIPEPSTALLLGGALALFVAHRRLRLRRMHSA